MKEGFTVDITCDGCGRKDMISITLLGEYQVMKLRCENCGNEDEESF